MWLWIYRNPTGNSILYVHWVSDSQVAAGEFSLGAHLYLNEACRMSGCSGEILEMTIWWTPTAPTGSASGCSLESLKAYLHCWMNSLQGDFPAPSPNGNCNSCPSCLSLTIPKSQCCIHLTAVQPQLLWALQSASVALGNNYHFKKHSDNCPTQSVW